MRIWFGVANLFMVPSTGNIPTLSTPQQLFTLQDFSVDIDATVKELRGQSQYPDDTAFADRKITWKSGMGRMDIDAMNNIVFGEAAISTGGTPVDVNEAHTIPNTTPYTITVTNSADTPLVDLGVYYTSGTSAQTGQKLTKTTGGVTTGLYSYSAGVYTFAAADAALGVNISYSYTLTRPGGNLLVTNHTQGYGPGLIIYASNPYQEFTAGVPNYMKLWAAKVTKTGAPVKRADYTIVPIEGEGYADLGWQCDFVLRGLVVASRFRNSTPTASPASA